MHMFRRRPRPSTIIATAALVLATSGTAIAAAPGDPFKLGQESRIVNASTTLSGIGQKNDGLLQLKKGNGPNAGAGAVLKVVNEGTGIARGIDINVAPGKPPIAVYRGRRKGHEPQRRPARRPERGATSSRASHLRRRRRPRQRVKGGGKTVLLSAPSAGLGCDTGDVALSAGGNAVDAERRAQRHRRRSSCELPDRVPRTTAARASFRREDDLRWTSAQPFRG